MNEDAKAELELKLAQARNLKTSWCTVDELRAEEGKQPLPNGEGKVVVGLKTPAVAAPIQAPSDLNATKGTAAKTADIASLWIHRVLRRKKKQ